VENTSPQPPSRLGVSQRTFFVSVVASVVASIIVGIFFQPIISFISGIVISTIGVFYRGWVDSMYVQAAGSTLFVSIYIVINILTLFPAGVLSGVVVSGFMAGRLGRPLSPRIARRATVLIAALLVPSVFIMNARIYTEFQATATFDQRLMALAPVISDQERKTLLRQWAMMKSRDDYDKINVRFSESASKYQIDLPPPFI
jgi:hypothetical protein